MRFSKQALPYCAVILLAACASGGGRHDRKEAAITSSGEAHAVAGGTTFQVPIAYDRAYDLVLNYLKRANIGIDQANRDAGQIITSMTIEGNYSQTGTRTQVVFIKDSPTATTVRVTVSEQKRKKLLQTEPWSDPTANDAKSQEQAATIKTALAGS